MPFNEKIMHDMIKIDHTKNAEVPKLSNASFFLIEQLRQWSDKKTK